MLKGIVDWSLHQRALVLSLALALLVAGVLQLRATPVDVLPDLARPTVSVQAEASQLAPEEVEALVSFPLESALAGMPGLQRLRSSSLPGLSLVQAEFAWGSDPYRLRQLVTERLESARIGLPADVQPRLGPVASLMGEVMLVAVRSPGAMATPAELREWADWVARPALLALPGVAQVLCIGGEQRQYEIQPDPERLRLAGVSVDAIERAARGFGLSGGAGLIEHDGREQALRSIGGLSSLDDLRDIAVAWRGDAPIRLRQVADVVEGARFKRGDAGVDGSSAVILSLQKQPGVDTLRLTAAVQARLQTLRASLPDDALVEPVFRQADFIEASVDNVRDALLHGALIAALVLLVVLGSGRATLAAAVAIPLSLAAAVIVLRALGLGINTMTLGGLAIAVGELVDDAVVGVDNVLRRLRENRACAQPLPPASVIALAIAEVRSGILVATVVIVLAIAPLLALGGVAGRLFAPLVLAYIAAIAGSLLVAITLTPALCLLGFGGAAALPPRRAWLLRFENAYEGLLTRCLDRRRSVAALTALMATVALIAGLLLPRSFLPPFSERTLTVNLLLSPGIGLSGSQRVALAAERLMLGVPEVHHAAHRSGRAEADEHAEGVHYTEFEVSLNPGGRPRAQVVADLRARLSSLPGSVSIGAPIAHRLDHVLSGVRAPLAIKLFGDDLDSLRILADQLVARLQRDPRIASVQAEPQVKLPQWQTRVDAQRAGAWGLSPPRVQDQIARLAAGQVLNPVIENHRRFDLVLRLPESARNGAALASLPIESPAGVVPLSWVADSTIGEGPNQILREDLRRRLVVSAYPAATLAAAGAAIDAAVAALDLPPGVEARIEGEQAAQRSTLRRLLGLGALSLLLMTSVIYARYRDHRLVAVVLSVVPLSAIGGVAALALTGTPLSAASGVGFVTLFGIATRNTLLKLSHYLDLLGEHPNEPPRALLLRAASDRLPPVVMTALAAALALAPLLIAADAPGKEILHPVALVIFGGLIVGTLLDAFLTPLLMELGVGARGPAL